MIRIKRVYEPPEASDGVRFLVDRLWPRGLKRDSLQMAGWLKEAAPDNVLRHWFNHDPAKWDEFRRRYYAALDANPEVLRPILDAVHQRDVTLLYAARSVQYNNAVALKGYLERNLLGN